MASMYAVYHGPRGLRAIARGIHGLTTQLANSLKIHGLKIAHADFFDTLRVDLVGRTADEILGRAAKLGMNLRKLSESVVGISLDETTTRRDLVYLCEF